jgi:hypothetical protein
MEQVSAALQSLQSKTACFPEADTLALVAVPERDLGLQLID